MVSVDEDQAASRRCMPVTRRREHARIGNPDIVDRPKAAPGIAWSASAGSHGASAGLVKRCRADVASSSRNNSALSLSIACAKATQFAFI
jgi:hypothetical protein